MRNLNAIRARTNPTWTELLTTLGANADVLADDFMVRIDGGNLYYDGRVPPDDLYITAVDAFLAILRTTRDGVPIHEVFPRDIGARRARQGVEPHNLVTAVHQDFIVVTDHLLAQANQHDSLAIATHMNTLWSSVDTFATAIQMAYTEERLRLEPEADIGARAYVELLVTRTVVDPPTSQRAARALGFDEPTGIWLAASISPSTSQLANFVEGVRASGRAAHYISIDEYLVAFWQATSRDHRNKLSGLPDGWRESSDSTQLTGVPCGIAPMLQALSGIAGASRLVREMISRSPADQQGPVSLIDAWHSIAASGLDSLFELTTTSMMRGFRPAPGTPDRDILDTVVLFARTGDMTETARRLCCHRNTVLKRLHKFRQLTGLDMMIPVQASAALVALQSVR